jgi:hypothetical protein
LNLEDRIKRLNHIEKEIRIIAITELLSLWENEKNNKIFDILFQRFLIEDDNDLIDMIAKGLTAINSIKTAVNIQELYAKEKFAKRKTRLVDLLSKIASPLIETYFYNLIAYESDEKMSHHIKSSVKKYRKSLIDLQKTESTLAYWEEIDFDDSIEDKICMICKLKFTKFHGILRCSVCEAYFHTEHILDWLIKSNDCPVCSRHMEDLD